MCCGFDFELLRMQDEGLRGIGWLGEREPCQAKNFERGRATRKVLIHTVWNMTSASRTTKIHSPVILNGCVCSLGDHRRSKALSERTGANSPFKHSKTGVSQVSVEESFSIPSLLPR